MEHAVHLAASHFVSEVAPTSPSKLIKKVKQVLRDVNMDGEAPDLDALNAQLDAFEIDGDADPDDSEDEDTEADLSDSLGKALVLVKQVRFCVSNLYHRGLNITSPDSNVSSSSSFLS